MKNSKPKVGLTKFCVAKANALPEVSHFITHPHEPVQVGYIVKAGSERVRLHRHKRQKAEVLVVMKGMCTVQTRGTHGWSEYATLWAGDAVFIGDIPHQLAFYADTVLFEVKVGAYKGDDKVYL